MNESKKIDFVFFGSSRLSVIVLDELLKIGQKPALIITTRDKPQGRKLEIKPNVVKEWAIKNDVSVLSPAKLDSAFIEQLKKWPIESLRIDHWPLFIVASYGKIIPNEIIEMPLHKTLNIHPSLLPKYRGASPLPTAMLDDSKATGISIMQLDREMDHGPIVAQRQINLLDHFPDWPTYEDFEEMMAKEGTKLLAEIMPDWVSGKIKAKDQDHSLATYTKKIAKEDGKVDFTTEQLKDLAQIPSQKAYEIFRKIQAFHEWPVAYFLIDHAGNIMRVKITQASFENKKLNIQKVTPEGRKEISFKDFVAGYIK